MSYLITRAAHGRASRFLAALLLLGGAALAVAPARADAQSRDLLNRFVGPQGDTDASSRAFNQARLLVDERKWDQAVASLSRFIAENPSDRNVDAALFYLAYVQEKQSRLKEADESLERLIERHPRSAWIDDAKALKYKVKLKLDPQGRVETPKPTDNDLIKVAALQALCQSDRARCSSVVGDVLRANPSPVVKDSAVKLLGRYGGAEAVPALIQMARSEPNEKLRMSAISALGSANDERAIEPLREVATGATFEDESPTDSAIHALAAIESPRATQALAEVIVNGRNAQARQHAVDLISRRRGDDVTDVLLRALDSSPDKAVRSRALLALGRRKDPRAVERLVQVARSAPDAELRKLAIRAIPERGDDADLDVLLSLYDTERDAEVKGFILDGLSRYDNRRAYQKLMQVVRDPNEPIERRTRVIQFLSRSKDPEVMKFLEDMVK